MPELPDEQSTRVTRAIIASDEEAVAGETYSRSGPGVRIGAVLVLVAAVVTALVLLFPGPNREEKAAVRSAVTQYAGMFREPTEQIYKYHKIQARRDVGVGWRVSITRVLVPGKLGGFGITSNFQIDRNGTCRYIGQVEGTGQ